MGDEDEESGILGLSETRRGVIRQCVCMSLFLDCTIVLLSRVNSKSSPTSTANDVRCAYAPFIFERLLSVLFHYTSFSVPCLQDTSNVSVVKMLLE